MTVKESIYNLIENSITSARADGRLPVGENPVFKVEYPKEQKFGDYATPFALETARILKRSPMEIGETLKGYLETSDMIGKVEVARPGFINIHISLEHLFKNLNEIISMDRLYGTRTKEKPRRVLIEFVSANPTGPLNIVSARAAAIGDSLANLLESGGDTVDREFYVNDYGNQFTLLGRSVLARIREAGGEKVEFPEDGYHGEYIKEIASRIIEIHAAEIGKINDEDSLVEFIAGKAVEYNVSGQKGDLEKFGVSFRNWFHESDLHKKGEVEDTFRYLEKAGVIYDDQGKKVFRSTGYGDDKDRVVVREDGRPTYLLADIAYHRNKINRGYDLIIDIWGPDHHGYMARLAGAVKAIGFDPEKFMILIAQQVNLIMAGETVKMSKRLGNFSTMRDLIDEIGTDVSRYFFTMRSLESHLDFDLALAKKESTENPVFYLQYAHARICSIFREAEKRGVKYDPSAAAAEHINLPEAHIILRILLKYPEEILDAGETFEPHRICTYLMRLSQSFHKFYTEHRVLSEDLARTNSFLALADGVRIVTRNALKILGVSAPERM
ncbi:MAG: arginine--tRNA ligase [Spirochaetes bacterium]|nr:arginine--tRNA ligase [Spirochaetota bacterium]